MAADRAAEVLRTQPKLTGDMLSETFEHRWTRVEQGRKRIA